VTVAAGEPILTYPIWSAAGPPDGARSVHVEQRVAIVVEDGSVGSIDVVVAFEEIHPGPRSSEPIQGSVITGIDVEISAAAGIAIW
jgi:hypothetical protein